MLFGSDPRGSDGRNRFGDRALPIIPDPRLRECDYGSLTRYPAADIELRRPRHITNPFPDGESYQEVVERTAAWLTDVAPAFAGRRLLVVGHRATFYALEHLLRDVPLDVAVTTPWQWQPGWTYRAAP